MTEPTFLDELIELERIENIAKKKHFKYPTKCAVCGNIFDNPRRDSVNAWKTCSPECRLKYQGHHRIGIRAPTAFGLHLKLVSSSIIDLDEVQEKEESTKHKTATEESLEHFFPMDQK